MSLLPAFDQPDQASPRALYWRMNYRNQRALRHGDWKYLAVEGNEYLFNLTEDERERANLAYRQPERLEAMRRQYAARSDGMRAAHPEARSELVYTERDMPRR